MGFKDFKEGLEMLKPDPYDAFYLRNHEGHLLTPLGYDDEVLTDTYAAKRWHRIQRFGYFDCKECKERVRIVLSETTISRCKKAFDSKSKLIVKRAPFVSRSGAGHFVLVELRDKDREMDA